MGEIVSPQSRYISSDQLSEPFDTGSFLSTFIPS